MPEPISPCTINHHTPHPMKTIVSTAKILSGVIAFCAQAHAALILDETFSDNNLTNQALPDSAAWYLVHGNNNGVDHTIAANNGTLKATITTRNTGNPGIIAYFSEPGTPIRLQNVGDSITVSFSLTTSSNTFPGGGWGDALRFGLYDSNGNRLTENKSTWALTGGAFASSSGYTVRGAVGNYADGSVTIQRRTTGNDDLFSSGTNVGSTGYVTGTLNYATTYDFSLSLSRTVNGIAYSFTYGAITLTGEDATPATWEFDTFALGFLSNAYRDNSVFILDNVRIETSSIPEPASVALLLGFLVMVPALRFLRIHRRQ